MQNSSRPFADNPLRGKPAAVVGTSTGLFGAVWAQAELRKVLGTIGADVLDAEFPLGQADDQFREDGRLLEASLHEALAEHVGGLALVATPVVAAAA